MRRPAVLVNGNRYDVDSVDQLPITRHANDIVKQPDFRLAQLPISTQSALEKDPLCHSIAGDQLDISLENGVIELLAILAADEVRAEGFEDVFERKSARPLADGIGDRHLPRQNVADEDVVGVRPMIHQID